MRTLRAVVVSVASLAALFVLSIHTPQFSLDAQAFVATAAQGAQMFLSAQADAKTPPQECAMVGDYWFRGERGCATAILPKIDADDWTESPTELGVTYYMGKPNSWKAQVMVLAWPAERAGEEKAEGLALSQKILDLYTGSFTKANPYMKPAKPATEIYSQGGKAMFQVFKGAAENKNEFTATFRVIADGRNALLMRMWSLSGDAWKANLEVVDPIYDTIRVGSHVPKLPQRDPGTALEGVYQGPWRLKDMSWLVFDKRGYVLDSEPARCKHINLEAYYQFRANQVGRYSVKDGEMTIDWPLREREDKRKFEATEKGFKLDGDEYKRMDNGWLDGKRLHGSWMTNSYTASNYGTVQSSFYSANYYAFFDNGKFKRTSTASSNYSDNMNRVRNDLPEFNSWASSHSSEFGVYRIEGNILVLNYADGSTSRLPIYPSQKDDWKLVYLLGDSFLKSDGGPGEMPPDMPGIAAQPKPPATFVPEIYRDGFLRARGGASILRLPKLDPEQYSVQADCAPGMTQLMIFKGKEIDKTSAVTVIYAMPADTFRDDTRDDKTIGKDVARRMADNFLKNRAYLKQEGEPKEVALPGGAAYSLVYVGSREGSTAKEAMSAITVTDEKCVLLLLTIGSGVEYANIVKAVVNPTLNNVRVGGKQPKLEDQKPGVALSGVYCTEPDATDNVFWLVFDPRGFINNRAPACECDLDLQALMLYDSAAVGRYEVKDGEIETAYAPPRVGGKAKFKQEAGKLTIGDVVYYRVDGGQRPRTGLSGKYAAADGAYFFIADGRFSTESDAGAGAAKNAEVRRAECVETAAVPAKASKSGCYRVEGDRLLLWYEDGRKLSRTMFVAPGKTGTVFIEGKAYSPAK